MASTTDLDAVAAVRALVPDIRAAADETEPYRRPSPAIIQKLIDARLFDLIKPKSIGGIETDVMTMMRVIEEAAIGDASTSVKATDIAYRLGGGTAVYEASVLQRLMRDVHTITQHVQLSPNNYEPVGRVLIGLDPDGMTF